MPLAAETPAVEPPVVHDVPHEPAERQQLAIPPALQADAALPARALTSEPNVAPQSVELSNVALESVDTDLRPVRWWQWPLKFVGFCWDFASLMVLLAVIAAVPIVQLASLGYLLRAAANLSQGGPWRSSFPGLKLAGRLATFALGAGLLWLPVWYVTDLSYSIQLLRPGTSQAANWRVGAFLVAFAWVTWTLWAAMRGGRWWHLLWPAPWRFVKQVWRPSTWSRVADNLWFLFQRAQLVSLWWLGLRAAAGALVWLAIPVSLMIIGLRAHELKGGAALIGLIGAASLTLVMLYLPFLQIMVAEKNRFLAIFQLREVRTRFRSAPLAFAASLTLLLALSIPLYLLRIEATPEQLTWLPSLIFVSLMFPAKLMMGAALGYGARRARPRHWTLRWTARLVCLTSALAYVGALYIAQFVAWQGIYVMYFQHAVLVPVAS